MTRISEKVSTWLVDWRLVTIMGSTMPPRDPNDDDDEDEEEGEDEGRDDEPAVVRDRSQGLRVAPVCRDTVRAARPNMPPSGSQIRRQSLVSAITCTGMPWA